MDGRKATTNKSVFTQLAQATPKVKWVARARWVEDGNIWTSSGVTAGMDMMHHFVSTIYGEKTATTTANTIEYSPNTDPRLDPFAEIWDVKQPTKET
jgi:transcriptional regulator GlxA family with amidase domain